MKKFIIAAALLLTTGVTAYSLSTKVAKMPAPVNAKEEINHLKVNATSSLPKSDIATAD